MQIAQTSKKNKSFLDRVFKLSDHNTNVKTEIIAGITTFMTMAYILVVNPSILGDAGMNKNAVFAATAIAAFIGSSVMGLLANYPIALAPGMGLNAFFAYTVVLQMGYSWQFALCAVLIEGLIFILLTVTNVREKIIDCIPGVLKHAVTAGIGLFIAFIGLVNAGIVEGGGAILQLGNMQSPTVLLAIAGLVIAAVLLSKNVKGTFLLAMVVTTVIGIVGGLVQLPSAIVSSVPSLKPVFLQAFSVPASQVFSLDMIVVVFTFLFVDLFDTVGCLVGVASKGNMLDENGKLPKAKQALFSDAIATTTGALLGTSTVTAYVESASGIGEGGRTGLTALTTGVLFLLSLFFAPIFTSIPPQATAPVLILVGVMMASSLLQIDFSDFTNAIPAFLTFAMMPLAYSIADGIIFGIISFTVLKLATGKKKEVNISLILLSIMFILKFILL
ncbi:xanthine/uracil permease family protein [[Clostridium] sordellii]|uniref:Xanthine/uracil/thiamine/ascorbate permease family protein n=1 Tax=Paraclostridium sordellii TaxID=1505 RepID=A0ABM9RSX0_PARSO|nr:NCS2 family permease [Paeniclostridium sordellii]CEJ75149.1 Xanthine/uracil/thiamine/ascorbate permease family protein [[Clostridium] sordellii] [Paeniclostridium sordellii]CEN70918.1 xanthine/uracil permease family protein [[Clostridium] sordellii] [Paeniclostridium sordellii]CEN74209.1 xanthine/uracil permease family protein [[Clostridium] sordellii] [Paeniclostridium sordellii]CEO30295.1 xanthine/uracil permease family protein [[Clostridium] sordellii] [Paeniclostridium sordellii]CEP6578